jgi:hypothetical protein
VRIGAELIVKIHGSNSCAIGGTGDSDGSVEKRKSWVESIAKKYSSVAGVIDIGVRRKVYGSLQLAVSTPLH